MGLEHTAVCLWPLLTFLILLCVNYASDKPWHLQTVTCAEVRGSRGTDVIKIRQKPRGTWDQMGSLDINPTDALIQYLISNGSGLFIKSHISKHKLAQKTYVFPLSSFSVLSFDIYSSTSKLKPGEWGKKMSDSLVCQLQPLNHKNPWDHQRALVWDRCMSHLVPL